jgi:hypothetical protein
MNRIEEPYFNKPETIPLNKTTATVYDSSSESINIGAFDTKTILILLLFFFLLISVLGINLLHILGNFLQSLSDIFGPVLNRFLNALGYSAGTALDKVSDVTADAAKVGIDIADGALNNIGGLLKGSGPDPSLVTVHNNEKKDLTPNDMPPPTAHKEPSPDSSENVIQKPITSDKWNWCLVGEYQNKRGCIEITDSEKCMSGQVFPSQQMCLNPTWTPNA